MSIGTWALSIVSSSIEAVIGFFVSIMNAVELWGFYAIMFGIMAAVVYLIGPLLSGDMSGSDRASRRDDDDD